MLVDTADRTPPDPADPSVALFFDLDGTLTDSAPGIVDSLLRALAEHGYSAPDEEFLRSIVGPPMLDNLQRLDITGPAAEAVLASYLREYYDAGWSNNTPFADVVAIAQELAARGRALAIATSKREQGAVLIAEHFGFADHFQIIGGASEDHTRRSKSDVIASVLDRMNLAANRVVMIGDRSHDIEGAASHGIPTIAVTWGYGDSEEHAAARWVAKSAVELRELVGV